MAQTFMDTSLNQVVFNKLSAEQYETELANDRLDDNQFYLIEDIDSSGVENLGYRPPLFSILWSDHKLNDIEYLRADTFSWHSGKVYEAAYNKLLEEYNNESSVSKTENGITFKVSPNGFKICDETQHNALAELYNTTGVAWYYMIDITNQKFKLPRTKFGFTGLRTGAGNMVEAGLPNITGTVGGIVDNYKPTGAFKMTDEATNIPGVLNTRMSKYDTTFDASRSSDIYGNSDTVQPPATEMHLYFYVGYFIQSAIRQTAGLKAEDLNSKADDDKVVHTSELVSEVLNIVYPVGSIYTSVNDVNPTSFIGGTWESIGSGRVLQGVGSDQVAGNTVEAGLPNITGTIYGHQKMEFIDASGAFSLGTNKGGDSATYVSGQKSDFTFDASRSNSIYGNSTTVQPPAYLVYFWKRTA